MFAVFLCLVPLVASVPQATLSSTGAIQPVAPAQATASNAFGIPSVSSPAKVPQLSVADILALRKAVEQRQLLSRSGIVSPSSGRLNGGFPINYVSDSSRSQYGSFPSASSSFGDYLAAASEPPHKIAKPSISTRFRTFMNSLFFRSSSNVAPAFYQPRPQTYYNSGPSFLPQPAQQPSVSHDFSKPSKAFPNSYADFGNKQVKEFTVAATSPKAQYAPSYSTSVSSSVSSLKKSVVPASPVSPSTSSGFYPSSSSASNPSYNKQGYSSLYGSNGFQAKTAPVKSSKSIKESDELKPSLPAAVKSTQKTTSSESSSANN